MNARNQTCMACLVIASLLLAPNLMAASDQAVRPDVGRHLQEAQKLHQAKKYQEALAKVSEAERAGKLSPYEAYIVQRMRSASAVGAGDYVTALRADEALLNSGQVSEEEKLKTLESVVKLSYAVRNYGRAISALEEYRAAGGNAPAIVNLLPELLYVSQRYGEAAKVLSGQLATQERAAQKPTQSQIQLLASCYLKQGDDVGYISALEKMVAYYPNQDAWLDLVVRTSRRPGFSDLLSLDVYRLRKRTGTLRTAADYIEAAQLALQQGFPGEADQYVSQGYDKGILGKGTASEVDRHKRLLDRIKRDVAADQKTLNPSEKEAAAQATGDALMEVGLNYVGYNQVERGLLLMEKGIRKGGLKKPELAKLHLAIAQVLAGRIDEASQTLESIQGEDGTRSLARLWLLSGRPS